MPAMKSLMTRLAHTIPSATLSKTQYLSFKDCPRHLWCEIHRPEFWPEPTPFELHTREQGYAVEAVAKKWLEGKRVPAVLNPSGLQPEWHWQETFSDGPYICRTDAWWQDPKSQGLHLYEIKSGTRVKSDHLYDLAFQVAIIEATTPVESIWVIHLNRDYEKAGELNPESLFTMVDVTQLVRDRLPDVLTERAQAVQVMQDPVAENWPACKRPKSCPCPSLCHPGVAEHSVFDLPGLRETSDALIELGITELSQVPDNFPLDTKQRRMVTAVKTGQPVIDRAGLAHFLQRLEYPLCFLDYEAYNAALPLYDGCHPQQQVVFQYSLHVVQHERDLSHPERIAHFEFLSFGPSDPSVDLVQHLKANMPDKGSVIVWNQSFEAGRNREMAAGMMADREFLLGLNHRMVDLAELFRMGVYVDKQFHGSWSIKNVLPVLAPELRYSDLPINKGDQALLAWWDIASGRVKSPEKRTEIEQNLLRYCQLDTWAMVKVWEFLHTLISQ